MQPKQILFDLQYRIKLQNFSKNLAKSFLMQNNSKALPSYGNVF